MNYLGQDIIISFLRERENWSYLDFLAFYYNEIVASSSSDNWKDLHDSWATRFLNEAKKLDQITFMDLKEKVKLERSQNVIKLERYWKRIIAERKKGPGKKGKGKENINSKETSTQPLNGRVLRKRNPINYSEANSSDVDFHVDDVERRLSAEVRSFSSYKTIVELKKVLQQYKVNDGNIMSIEQFIPISEKIDDDDKAFNRCMENIEEILTNIKTMSDANEYTRCGFIFCILQASITIARRATDKEISIVMQEDISGYLQNIKQLESAYYMNKKKRTADQAFRNNYYDYLYGIVSTAEEWHFIIYTSEGIYSTNNNEHLINLSKTAVKENPEVLRNNVKRIVGIIVGLLKDRVSVDNSSARKRVRIKKIIKK